MVGELRDRETLEAALHAAETGAPCDGYYAYTKGCNGCSSYDISFPGEQQEEVRSQISQVLRAVICQSDY